MRPDRRNRMQDLRRLTVAILYALLTILQDVRGEIVSIATPGTLSGSPAASRTHHRLNAWFI
jgi:hypothetical protein